MKTNSKAVIYGLMAAVITFIIIFPAITASRKANQYNKRSILEKYYHNFSISAPRQMIVASPPFKITNGIWVYLTYNGTDNIAPNKLNFLTELYAPTRKLSIGDTVQAIKFHGNSNYDYFYIK